jgi:hypothetical protein
MDRTVPRTGSEEIELYMRTYYSLLRSTDTIQIETLVESHMAMESSLHVKARAAEPDIAALTYTTLRLPAVMTSVDQILIGQIERAFAEAGYHDVTNWKRVDAPGRRRRVHFDGDRTLAVFIASRSDIDDLVPILTAYQIEWNKLHDLLKTEVARLFLTQNQERQSPLTESEIDLLTSVLHVSQADVRRLEFLWQPDITGTLKKISERPKRIGLRLLSSSVADYRKATSYWWREVEDQARSMGVEPQQRPVYFVSSNTHSLPNLLTGFAWREEEAIIDYVKDSNHRDLLEEYNVIRSQRRDSELNNFLYYVLKKYVADHGPAVEERILTDEREIGIYRAPNKQGFQIAAQIIEIRKLRPDWLDPRLCDQADFDLLVASDALIINIDYPLGLAAYEILNRVTEQTGHLLGVYIMGKAATLNARLGDVMIPNVVHDEHSQNTYLFNNCFTARDIAPYMAYGMVLDNQKAISAPGTFLQNPTYMSVFYHEGYTDIEMEAGPYLSAVYEAFRPKRHPQNEIANMHGVPFDLGFLHYASDTPMGRGHNLGTSNLSYTGIDPTYASAIAILRRILHQETQRLRRSAQQSPPLLVETGS